MSKYTILKAFSQLFKFPIWKIEVDELKEIFAIECRNPETTLAYISVINFKGELVLDHYELPQKEWSLASVQHGCVVLKKFSENSPIHPGVWILDYKKPNEEHLYHQYQYLAMLDGYVQMRPQQITSGYTQYFGLKDQTILTVTPADIKPLESRMVFPITYQSQKPDFLANYQNEDLWISKIDDHFIWTFHEMNNEKHNVRLVLSDKTKILAEEIIIENLDLKLVQIYFQINRQLFLLTDNKQEFASYLV